jgi:hypothetical protein
MMDDADEGFGRAHREVVLKVKGSFQYNVV